MSRPREVVYRDWVNRILPTLRRHRAGINHLTSEAFSTFCCHAVLARFKLLILTGTLEDDVRGELIEEVARRGWQYSSDVEFPTLASMSIFKGHTPNSLSHLYGDMVVQVVGKQKRKGVKLATREVTVTQMNNLL